MWKLCNTRRMLIKPRLQANCSSYLFTHTLERLHYWVRLLHCSLNEKFRLVQASFSILLFQTVLHASQLRTECPALCTSKGICCSRQVYLSRFIGLKEIDLSRERSTGVFCKEDCCSTHHRDIEKYSNISVSDHIMAESQIMIHMRFYVTAWHVASRIPVTQMKHWSRLWDTI